MRKCFNCNLLKRRIDFPRSGTTSICNQCTFKNPNRNRARFYGLEPEEHNAILARQKGCCPICENDLEKPQIDHCHKTGEVRGILCKSCNIGIGFFKDNPTVCRRAASYLERRSSKSKGGSGLRQMLEAHWSQNDNLP